MKKSISLILSIILLLTIPLPGEYVHAQSILNLPQPGTLVSTTSVFKPAIIKGITVSPENPLKFNFIVDKGSTQLIGDSLRDESMKLINYFLASLTIPEQEMWVNLSPYEKNRIIPKVFGRTDMGKDLLAQDYMLKQLTSSLMHPDEEIGKEFWERIYTKANEKHGTINIPVNTFNKIWIVPEKAVIYEHKKGAFIVSSKLKVLLEEDYLALEVNKQNAKRNLSNTEYSIESDNQESAHLMKEILIPVIEKEVNEGEVFANLRQIYSSMLLATWYKRNLRSSLLGREYVGQNKVFGIENNDRVVNQEIYNQYVESFKKGVFDFIREDFNEELQESIPRHYFSGGVELDLSEADIEFIRSDENGEIGDAIKEIPNPVEIGIEVRGLSKENVALEGKIPGESDGGNSAYNEIEKLLDEKNSDRIVLTIEGSAGSGKNFVGNLIKEKGISRFGKEDVVFVDLDDYLPQIVSDGFDRMIKDSVTGELFIPPGDWTEYIDYQKFERDFLELMNSKKLIVVVGLFMSRFFDRISSFRPSIRTKIETSPSVARMRVARRDGYMGKFIDSLKVIKETSDLAKEIPIDLIIQNNDSLFSKGDLFHSTVSLFRFVEEDVYGEKKEEKAYKITSERDFEALNNIIIELARSGGLEESVTEESGEVSDIESVVAGVFAILRYLFSSGDKEVVITLRGYERGIEAIIQSPNENVVSAKEAANTLLRPALFHVPEVIVSSPKDWFFRTFGSRSDSKWVPTSGAIYGVGMPSQIPDIKIGWKVKEEDGAMLIQEKKILDNENDIKGGIDLDPAILNMDIYQRVEGVELPSFGIPFGNLKFDGAFPIIINIQPIINLSQFLGLQDRSEKKKIMDNLVLLDKLG